MSPTTPGTALSTAAALIVPTLCPQFSGHEALERETFEQALADGRLSTGEAASFRVLLAIDTVARDMAHLDAARSRVVADALIDAVSPGATKG